jgi:phosphatidylinositol glycan class B
MYLLIIICFSGFIYAFILRLNFTYIQRLKLAPNILLSTIISMRFERGILIAALAIYTVSAWFSSGFLHGDEHYQIIEFAAHKLGMVSAAGLAWEFESMVRPGLQPFIAFIILSLLNGISLTDPYIQAFILRLLTALTALSAIKYFTVVFRTMIKPEYHRIFLFLSYFLWFLPFVNVRFSSEAWSGIMLLYALSIAMDARAIRERYIIVGLLLGFSFLFRYQNAFLALGVFLWLIFIKKENFPNLVKLAGAALLVFIIGIGIDYWLYEKLTLTSWNYFYVNLVEDVASGYGTERWWNYFYSIFRFSFFPIGIPVILSFLYFLIRKPRHIVTWTVLPFFIIHSIIAHKELRFLFPVVNLVPFMLVIGFQELKWDLRNWRGAGPVSMKILAIMVLIINCIGTLTVSLKPADGGFTVITRYIRQNYGEEPIRLISYNNSNPYGPWGLMASFYMEEDMEDTRLESLDDLYGWNAEDSSWKDGRVNLLILKREDAGSEITETFLEENRVTLKQQSIPEWMEPLMTLYGGFRLREILQLYEFPRE